MHHRHIRERRIAQEAQKQAIRELVNRTYNEYLDQDPPLAWPLVLAELMNRTQFPPGVPGYLPHDIAKLVGGLYFKTQDVNPEHFTNTRYYIRIWRWLRLGGADGGRPVPLPDNHAPLPPPPPPPVVIPRLHAIAQDVQNVHTREVSEQTNESTRTLLEGVVPLTQKTEQTLVLAWYGLPNPPAHHKILKTAVDMNKWFMTDTCRQEGDRLYRHVLRGLVAYIQKVGNKDLQTELWTRAWEECYESVGMCCEGHISRLCNVLVGFDEAFKPPVPFSEILQSKMAAIAGMDVPMEEKIQQANTFFNEYAVPPEQRQAWLDAFSEE
jgi:hypothetical protein